jgi:glycine/D-amino acid oxidase-like deaminating enzyme
MKIVVVGAGYAGLALSWYLQKEGASVSLLEARGVGAGASGVSTGLLHPYHARKDQFVLHGTEAMQEARNLLDVAEEALGAPVALRTGMMRFQAGAGQWIPEGITVFSFRYLQGLAAAFTQMGGKIVMRTVIALQELDYDVLVLANGYEVLCFPEGAQLPLKLRKGQTVICRGSIPYSMIGNGHLSLMEEPGLCHIGSTYEDDFDEQRAFSLREKVSLFFPAARDFEVVAIRAGTRIAPQQGSLPLLQEVRPNVWVLSGFGSRGLLYHALFARALMQKLLNLNDKNSYIVSGIPLIYCTCHQ